MSFKVLILDLDQNHNLFINNVQGFNVVISMQGLTDIEKFKVNLAVGHWIRAYNSGKLKGVIVNHPRPFTYLNKFKKCSKDEIYQAIIEAKEVIGDGKSDGVAQVYLNVDRRNKRGIVGYTYPSTKFQWVYSWVLKRYSPEQIAGNLGHEHAHKIGLGDSSFWKSKDAITYIVGSFISNFKPSITS
jgi:hypothetical protein